MQNTMSDIIAKFKFSLISHRLHYFICFIIIIIIAFINIINYITVL